MRWLRELLPEVCPIEPTVPRPAEVDLDHEYLRAIDRDGLLADERFVSDAWLFHDALQLGQDLDALERREEVRRYANRVRLCRTYSWAIPNQSAIDRLAELAPLVEIGAGGGYWAKLLRERGVDIVAYDAHPPPEGKERENGWARKLWTEVRFGTGLAFKRHQDRTLVLCWPSPGLPNDCWAAELLRSYFVERLVFIGEAVGGCTGSRAFHERLERDFNEVGEVTIPRHSGIHDQLWTYQHN